MLDQVLTTGVTVPLAIKWAVESPFDRGAKETAVAKNAEDANKQIKERSNKEPRELVPQLAE